jgi:hypothetical protein
MAQHGYLRDNDEARDRDLGRERGWRSEERDRDEREQGFMFGNRPGYRRGTGLRSGSGGGDRSPRHFSSRQDDYYLSWRDKQKEALDRDYADYCREREQQFHEDFDAWRRRRQSHPEPLQTGTMQTGQSSDVSGTLELSREDAVRPQRQPDPVDTATLGATSTGRPR